MKFRIFFLLFYLIISGTNGSFGGSQLHGFSLNLGYDVGILSGFTQYQIGDGPAPYTYFPLSELKFPTNVVQGGIEAKLTGELQDTIQLSINKNISRTAGKMEDSDWGIGYLTNVSGASTTDLDVFSTSDAFLDHLGLTFDYLFPITSEWSVAVGYLYQKFNYSIHNVDQYSPSGLPN